MDNVQKARQKTGFSSSSTFYEGEDPQYPISLFVPTTNQIDHFRVALNLIKKARLSAKFLS